MNIRFRLLICVYCAVSTAPLSTSGTPAPASNTSVVQLIQFTVPYQLSQITDTVRKNMALAIAEIIGVDVTMIFLSFTTVSRRSRGLLQANEVLVTADLVGFEGPTKQFQSLLTEDNINKQFASLGLQPVTLATQSTAQAAKPAFNSTAGIQHNWADKHRWKIATLFYCFG